MATLEDAQNLCRDLPQEDLGRLRTWLTLTEIPRREALPQIEAALAEETEKLWEAQPDLKPAFETEVGFAETVDGLLGKLPAWVKPTSLLTAYPAAALVKHEGRLWRARWLTDKEPGTALDGWEDVTDHFLVEPDEADEPGEIAPAPQVPEWEPGELLAKGATRLYGGALYVCERLHTTSEGKAPGNTTYWQKLD